MNSNTPALALVVVSVFAITSASCGSGNHLVSIAVNPNSSSINAPGSIQLQAIGTFSNGKTSVLSSANWTSSSPAVGVSNTGLATCSLMAGPAVQSTITASVSSTDSMGTMSGSGTVFCVPPNP
jgi:hypothetical protein